MPAATFRGRDITDRDVLDAMAMFDQNERAGFTEWKRYVVQHGGSQYPTRHLLRMIGGHFPKVFLQ